MDHILIFKITHGGWGMGERITQRLYLLKMAVYGARVPRRPLCPLGVLIFQQATLTFRNLPTVNKVGSKMRGRLGE